MPPRCGGARQLGPLRCRRRRVHESRAHETGDVLEYRGNLVALALAFRARSPSSLRAYTAEALRSSRMCGANTEALLPSPLTKIWSPMIELTRSERNAAPCSRVLTTVPRTSTTRKLYAGSPLAGNRPPARRSMLRTRKASAQPAKAYVYAPMTVPTNFSGTERAGEEGTEKLCLSPSRRDGDTLRPGTGLTRRSVMRIGTGGARVATWRRYLLPAQEAEPKYLTSWPQMAARPTAVGCPLVGTDSPVRM